MHIVLKSTAVKKECIKFIYSCSQNKNHDKNKRQFVNCIAKIRCYAVSKNLRGVPSKRCKGGKKSEVGLDLVSVPKEV